MPRVKVTKNGPYLVSKGIPLLKQVIEVDEQSASVAWRTIARVTPLAGYALCRCGHSRKKPFCDGSHERVRFDGTETADRSPRETREYVYPGPALTLSDDEHLCAFARFCDLNGSVWRQVDHTDNPEVAKTFTRQVNDCPAGRLVAFVSADGTEIETQRPKAIGVVEDPQQGCSGPLWLKGGIAIDAADGTSYTVRNRVTLCRCGASANKPFCDGSHARIGFRDEL